MYMQTGSWNSLCRRMLNEIAESYKLETKRSPRIKLDEDFQIKEIRVSQSFLKQLFFRGEFRNFCPLKLYHLEIIRDYQKEPTLNMVKGLYFESKCLGETVDGSKVLDLPRKRNGEMTVDQIRTALDHMEENYGLAMDYKEYGLARAFKDKIDWLMAELNNLELN